MAVHSSQVPLGTALPDQTLPDLTGKTYNLRDLRGDGVLVVAWAANHCPYVRHIERALGSLAAEFAGRGATFAAICSNDASAYPDDALAGLSEQANRAGWQFPYLLDEDQFVAKQFGAVCTPDFFAYDVNGRLGYRGAFDASTPKNGEPVTGDDLRAALELLVATAPVPEPQRPSMGCSIKWRE
ncbi:MAG: thioredoxin family protein [Candidatus Nanopelagicales bacterium]